MLHTQPHLSHRTTWLRASVLGANDGIISTASLILGVASTGADQKTIIIAGIIALISGAFSMAAGEYVSVSSQTDLENADLQMEQNSIRDDYEGETQELADIYQSRGLPADLAAQVADHLMAHDALSAHARDDIGLSIEHKINPIVAALSSALAFAVGALLPLLAAILISKNFTLYLGASTIAFLLMLGGISAYLGNAPILKGALRVTIWGTLAMSISAYIGHLLA